MSTLKLSENPVGRVKPVHGVGQPPFSGLDFSMIKYLKDAGIPFSRLHDVGGWFGGNMFVDIPNLFRDFDADPDDPESYDFTFTDMLITALMENGVEPFFRLGVTIENFSDIKAYRIYPPADFEKWAAVCEKVIAHYTEGWADGFRYDIRFWEIWNEPDNDPDPVQNHMWLGTKEQFYELYDITAKRLKARFPHLMIGGYSSCGFYDLKKSFIAEANSSPRFEYFIEFFDGFIDYIKAHGSPMDFFSWHSYDDPENVSHYARWVRRRLDEAGFGKTLSVCNEWNRSSKLKGSPRHAALTAAMLTAFDREPVDSAMFYDAGYGVSRFRSLFDASTAQPLPAYWVFVAFNELYKMKDRLEIEALPEGLYADAASDGGTAALLIANPTDAAVDLDIPGEIVSCRAIDGEKKLEETEFCGNIPADTVLLVRLRS